MNTDAALARTLPELRQAELKLRGYAAKEGIVYEIAPFGAFRTESDTAKILKYRDDDYAVYVRNMQAQGKGAQIVAKEKWRRIAPYGRSFHDYGAAFDVQVMQMPSGMTLRQALVHLGALAGLCGLRWGGSFDDPVHFELDIGITDAADRWDAFTNPPDVAPPESTPALPVFVAPIVVPVLNAAQATTAVAKRHPAAATTIGLGAVVAAALLTWLVIRRVTD